MSASGKREPPAVLSRELAEIVRSASCADPAEPLSRHLQVDMETDPCGGPGAPSDPPGRPRVGDRGAEGAGDGVLPEGVRGAPGAGRAAPGGVARLPRLFRRSGAGGAWRLHLPAAAPMLAVDIETTGLDARVDEVTCACVYCPEAGVERSFVFGRDGPAAREEFLGLLDAAPRLCAFNGARFDLPFLARRWNVGAARVGAWMRKLVDPFEASKLALGRTFSLDRLLAANGLSGKTGSGLHAVAMAREGRWDQLAEYCMHDTRMTHAVAAMPAVFLPEPAARFRR